MSSTCRPTQRAEKDRLVAEYRRTFANPFKAAELGYVDEVIMPEDTRPRLIRSLRDPREQARSQSAEEAWEHSTLVTSFKRQVTSALRL